MICVKILFKKCIYLFCLILLTNVPLIGQSLTGTTGLLRIPTANLAKDKTVILGASFLNKQLLAYSNYRYDAIAAYATLGFLPFLEISIRYTRQIDRGPDGYEHYFADRMPSFRLRLLKEKKNQPAFAIGSGDFITSIKDKGPQMFASYYAVITKNLFANTEKPALELTVGYAFKIGNARYYDMRGIFGGARIYHPKYQWLSAMIDFDSRYWNMGIRLFLFKHLHIMPVLRNGNIIEGNIAYWIYL